jgi:hypothetical protein
MYEDNHYCHPGGVAECATHTTKEIFDSLQTQKDTEFYAVIDQGLVGFVTYKNDMSLILNFGITIASRRSGKAAKFMELVRKFGNNEKCSVRVSHTNKRDIIMLQSVGFATGPQVDADHSEMTFILSESEDNSMVLSRELTRLYKLRMEIESERKQLLKKLKRRIDDVQLNIDQITNSSQMSNSQLNIF